ncbi:MULTISPECIES: SEL1-like repeat protein [unclassified Lebetimonas]|uniref:SEL1-like repeat protein n=1 Tax=unclassified Lebetimonas TaxID=2648158 RepID=UPI0004644400|nr:MULTISPECIES: SEL1-like repeat protein [unclassified Lebetimonas]
MKKIILLILITFVFSQNLYFIAFKDIQKAKHLLNSDPQKANTLFIEAGSYLKQIINSSINSNKPSSQALNLLGELYLNGWGVEKDIKKARLLLCAAKNLGNFRAQMLIKKNSLKCPAKINLKELKQ